MWIPRKTPAGVGFPLVSAGTHTCISLVCRRRDNQGARQLELCGWRESRIYKSVSYFCYFKPSVWFGLRDLVVRFGIGILVIVSLTSVNYDR